MLEPILKEMGNINFQWMEIQRTKASLIQQLDMHTNYSLNDSLSGFGFAPSAAECEYKCPELDACIDENLWCDGEYEGLFSIFVSLYSSISEPGDAGSLSIFRALCGYSYIFYIAKLYAFNGSV